MASGAPAPRLASLDLPLAGKRQGKVREWWDLNGTRLVLTTDRQSAFDRVLGTVPYKGQVLNRLSAWWFERTADIVDNHMLAVPDPAVMLVRRARLWPVEMVVRGYITGVTTTSLWYAYERGEREIYGLPFPDGLTKNQRLAAPVITPTTKAVDGGHDERLTRDEIIGQGIVPADVYAAMEAAALALFARGTELAAARGVLLVDTKYEFGDVEGRLTLIDEVHTPDSSRFWIAESYQARVEQGQEPETFDKEFLRRWYVDQGYRGEGDPPPLPDSLAERMSGLYREVFEKLTGTAFVPDSQDPAVRIPGNLRAAGLLPEAG